MEMRKQNMFRRSIIPKIKWDYITGKGKIRLVIYDFFRPYLWYYKKENNKKKYYCWWVCRVQDMGNRIKIKRDTIIWFSISDNSFYDAYDLYFSSEDNSKMLNGLDENKSYSCIVELERSSKKKIIIHKVEEIMEFSNNNTYYDVIKNQQALLDIHCENNKI